MASRLGLLHFLLLPGRLLGRLLGLKLAAFSVGLGGFSLTSDRFRLSARRSASARPRASASASTRALTALSSAAFFGRRLCLGFFFSFRFDRQWDSSLVMRLVIYAVAQRYYGMVRPGGLLLAARL